MSNVASNRLAGLAAVGAASVTAYTCPANTRTIVKSIWVRNATAGVVTFSWAVALSGGATITFFQPLAATPAAGSTVKIEPWIVLRPGDVLKVSGAAGSGCDVYVSGAELLT